MSHPDYARARHEQGPARPVVDRHSRRPPSPTPAAVAVEGLRVLADSTGRVFVELALAAPSGTQTIALQPGLARALGAQLLSRVEGR